MRVAGCQVNKRGETVDEKIKKLDEELARYKDQIRKTRPGPSQEAIKARAIRLLKHKRMYLNSLSPPMLSSPFHFSYTHFHFCFLSLRSFTFPTHTVWHELLTPLVYFDLMLPCLRRYEEHRNMLYNQTYNLDQVAFAADGLKDAQQTVRSPKAVSSSKLFLVCNV
jgi:hypothetical protein